jgi:hypothetical protein
MLWVLKTRGICEPFYYVSSILYEERGEAIESRKKRNIAIGIHTYHVHDAERCTQW